MKRDKYMGLDVHQATTVVAVQDAEGKVVFETIIETEGGRITRLLEGLSGPMHVALEETTQAEWLCEVIRPWVREVVVCDPRRNKLLQEGSKGDKPDARKLAELLRVGLLRSVYHGHEATRELKQLVQAYDTFCLDTRRGMSRIKAIYRGRGIPTPGRAIAAHDSTTGPRAGRTDRRHSGHTVPIPDESAVLELQWPGGGDTHERRVRDAEWACGATAETGSHARIESELQSPIEVRVFLSGNIRSAKRAVPDLLGQSPTARDAGGNGTGHPGPEDRRAGPDALEERRIVRSGKTELDDNISRFEP